MMKIDFGWVLYIVTKVLILCFNSYSHTCYPFLPPFEPEQYAPLSPHCQQTRHSPENSVNIGYFLHTFLRSLREDNGTRVNQNLRCMVHG